MYVKQKKLYDFLLRSDLCGLENLFNVNKIKKSK